jgi:predicted dehydrogenase
MKPLKVGVLGIGDISDVYISNLKTYDIVSIVAFAGHDLEKARRKAEAHGLPKDGGRVDLGSRYRHRPQPDAARRSC